MTELERSFFSITEDSFKEVLHDKVVGIDRKRIVALIKNIRAQSYDGANMFEDPAFGQGEKCKVVYSAVPNPLTPEEWKDQCKLKVPYHPMLTALCIPIWIYNQVRTVQARLVLCTPEYGPDVIAIQIRYGFSEYTWSTVYCKTNTVKVAIKCLIQLGK